MYFLNEIKRIAQGNKIKIFADMDGVIADYRFGEGVNIKNNIPGTYFNKRPILTTITNLKILSMQENIELFILSSCLFQEQAEEKNNWLNKYANFFKPENRIYIISNDFESRKQLKVDKLKMYDNLDENELIVLIDDTHDILNLAKKQLGESFIPMHVITLID